MSLSLNLNPFFTEKRSQPVRHTLGYCTCTSASDNGLQCPECNNMVKRLHQPCQYNSDLMVCETCYLSVYKRENSDDKP